ncbi:MAG: hypothetical protein EOP00_33935, partial [Pedobacter sp.]
MSFLSKGANPVNGQTDCGLIQGNIFYSDTYAPPSGTPVTSGSCTWVRKSNTSCAIRNYGGTNYTLYPHTYTCNAPIDDYAFIMLVIVAFFALSQFKIDAAFSFSTIAENIKTIVDNRIG